MNKNKLLKIGFSICILLCIIFVYETQLSQTLTVNASNNETEYTYIRKEEVGENILVNVPDEIVPFLQETGIDVRDNPETTGWWL